MKRAFPVAVLAAALVAAWLPLLAPATIAGHSTLADLVRAEAIHAAVAGGDLWPAWLPDLYDRHGSPLPGFYAPLGYALVEVLRWATGDGGRALALAYLLLWGFGTAGAAVAARAAFGPGAGVSAAAAFALAPYLLADVYVRAGLAEFAAFALLPWALAALARPGRWALAGGALALAALVLAHNVTGLLAAPALAALALAGPADGRRRGLALVAAGLALSCFFWLPALAEKRLLWADESLTGGYFDYARHFVAPWDLLPGRTAVRLATGPHAEAAVRVGELLWAGLIATALLLRRLAGPVRRRAALYAAAALGALAMASSLAAPLWRLAPPLAFVQFPFRFLLFATAFAAPLVGLAVTRAPERWRAWLSAATVALALLLARPALDVRYLLLERATLAPVPVPAAELARAAADPGLGAAAGLITIDAIRGAHWSGSAGHEYLPRTVTILPDGEPVAAASALTPGVRVVASGWAYPAEVRAEVDVTAPGEVALAQFWFPGWRVEVDGRERAAAPEPGRGRIVVALAPGERAVVARFGPTPLRRAAALASALAAAALAAALLASRRKGLPTA
ncbi:MAG: rane protein of unknown function [Acidobacteria bacterium]|nr:rane protein of unknown function [Acidobacteriota bacterium]